MGLIVCLKEDVAFKVLPLGEDLGGLIHCGFQVLPLGEDLGGAYLVWLLKSSVLGWI